MENSSPYIFFSAAEGNLLIRILIAQILAFVIWAAIFKKTQKKYLQVLVHGALLVGITLALTQKIFLTAYLALLYVPVLIASQMAQRKFPKNKEGINILEKVLLAVGGIFIWCISAPSLTQVLASIGLIMDYKASLIGLGYLWMMWPASYLVQYLLLGIDQSPLPGIQSTGNIDGGQNAKSHKLIGISERLIILTLVLLGEYSAIGFLITGKSIIRFGEIGDAKIRSEYVLAGTLASYAVAILTGVLINWLIKLA